MFGDDPIERIRLAVEELAAEDRREWSGSARSDHLVELIEVAERLQAETVRSVGEWDARADWALDCALSPRAWLAHRAPISRSTASRLVSMARLSREHEATGDALRSGAMSCAHVEVLAPMVRNREAEYARNEQVFVATAATMKVDDFAVLARNWRSIADDQLAPTPDADEIHERRNLHVHTSLYGMGVIDGDLDAEGTETLLNALDLACPPDPTGGPVAPRSLSQRRADALVDIAGVFLVAKGVGSRPPVGLNVTMDYGTLTGEPPADLRQLRCELERVGPIPLETALRLACDCAVGRVVMRGDSEVLDLGSQTRLVSRALRRALVLRDRGCVFPGCDRPAQWCDAHHIIWWEHEGPTNEENCCLLCRRHHVLCHEGGWGIRRAEDGTYEIQEPPATYTRNRQRGRAPPIAA
jgi:hypothetical protein